MCAQQPSPGPGPSEGIFHRDFVILELTHVSRFARGERSGYEDNTILPKRTDASPLLRWIDKIRLRSRPKLPIFSAH
jgi:hypothetical protein